MCCNQTAPATQGEFFWFRSIYGSLIHGQLAEPQSGHENRVCHHVCFCLESDEVKAHRLLLSLPYKFVALEVQRDRVLGARVQALLAEGSNLMCLIVPKLCHCMMPSATEPYVSSIQPSLRVQTTFQVPPLCMVLKKEQY